MSHSDTHQSTARIPSRHTSYASPQSSQQHKRNKRRRRRNTRIFSYTLMRCRLSERGRRLDYENWARKFLRMKRRRMMMMMKSSICSIRPIGYWFGSCLRSFEPYQTFKQHATTLIQHLLLQTASLRRQLPQKAPIKAIQQPWHLRTSRCWTRMRNPSCRQPNMISSVKLSREIRIAQWAGMPWSNTRNTQRISQRYETLMTGY